MKNLIFKTLTLMVIHLNTYSKAIDFDEGCFIGEKPFLQVAFAIDRTGTFVVTGGKRNFYRQFSELVPTLFSEINKDYPGSEFALSVHGDWEIDADPPHGTRNAHTNPEGCYTRLVEFTTDTSSFVTRMLNITVLANGEQENGLSALAFTAADPEIGWIRNATAPNGRPVRRVLILVTDEDDLLLIRRPRNRTDFKADGTDRCKTSKPPTHKILREVFEKYQMTVLSLLAVTSDRKNVEALYQKHFEKIGSSIKYCGRPFILRSRSKGIRFTNMKSNFEVPKDFWSGEGTMGPGESENGINSSMGLGLTNDEIKQIATGMPTARADEQQYGELVTFIKDCLKETDDGGNCLFGDPEGYNTLGF